MQEQIIDSSATLAVGLHHCTPLSQENPGYVSHSQDTTLRQLRMACCMGSRPAACTHTTGQPANIVPAPGRKPCAAALRHPQHCSRRVCNRQRHRRTRGRVRTGNHSHCCNKVQENHLTHICHLHASGTAQAQKHTMLHACKVCNEQDTKADTNTMKGNQRDMP